MRSIMKVENRVLLSGRRSFAEVHMKIVIGADKGGFALKEAIAARLAERGIDFEDVGTVSLDACMDFVSVAERAAGIVSRGEAERGI